MPKAKGNGNRYSISVTGKTYDRLHAAVPRGDVARVVDEIVAMALDDPAVAARLVDQCRRREEYS